jgi:hypothetical protein
VCRFVQTDMGNTAAQRVGMQEATTTIKDSVDFLTKTVGFSIEDGFGAWLMLEVD